MAFNPSEVSLLLTDDPQIKELNHYYRKKNTPTDVLSFPQEKLIIFQCDRAILGDIVISVETAARQAKEHNHSLREEIIRLLIHGLLHLFGYDHENVPSKRAKEMQDKEKELLGLVKELL